MDKDDRLELQWACLCASARLDAQSSPTPVVIAGEGRRLFVGQIAGLPFLVVEAPSLPHPATIPWSNVASCGWLTPPAVEWVTAPPAPEKAANKGRFVAKPKVAEEPAA